MSAVLKPEKLETIFDHNITDTEMQALTDGYPEEKQEYLYALSQDGAYADLYRLYSLRGDAVSALAFLEKITDTAFKNQFKMRPCCAGHS